MQTIADHRDSASNTAPRTRHAALLALAANEDNWHKPSDCRPAVRRAICESDLPPSVQQWALWLVDRFDARGELYRGDVASIIRLSPLHRATIFRYLAQLERAGIVERFGTARRTGPGSYRRVTYLRVAADLRKSQRDTFLKAKAVGTPDTLPVGGSVRRSTSRRYAREREIIDPKDRDAVDNHWPACARSRTDLPALREGYSTNATQQRHELDALLGERLDVEPPAPPRTIDPAVAAAVAADPHQAVADMFASFGSLPDDVESRPR